MSEKEGPGKGWFQRSLDYWSPFWIMVAGVCAVLVAVLSFVLVRQAEHSPAPPPTTPTPAPTITTFSPTPTTFSPTPTSSTLTAGKIANDVTGDTVNAARHSGATVSSATCYPSLMSQSGDGATDDECDLAYSDGAVFRAAVSDNGGNTSFTEQYQENLSTGDIADYAVGDSVTSGSDAGATVSSATCYAAELQSNGWTYGTCDLDLSNGAVIRATVEDNGIRSYFQS